MAARPDRAMMWVMETRLERWQSSTEWVLTGAACAFLVAYSWEVIAELSGTPRAAAEAVMNTAWVLFAIDVVVRLTLAEDRGEWFRHHLLDVASVALPVLRPLRLLRLVALVTVLLRTAGHSLRGKIATYTGGSAVPVIRVAALAVLNAERHAAGASITDFPKALWWAFVTVTTVGYGDLSPATTTGRVVAVALMIGGIAVLGVVTATLASWIVSGVSAEEAEEHAATRGQVAELQDRVRRLTDLVVQQRGSSVHPQGN